jgi:hypothetical protein
MSIGVAIFPTDGSDASALVGNADAALYRAKAEGRGTVRFFEPEMDKRLRDRRAMQHDLRSAIERNELAIHFQPQADVAGEVVRHSASAQRRPDDQIEYAKSRVGREDARGLRERNSMCGLIRWPPRVGCYAAGLSRRFFEPPSESGEPGCGPRYGFTKSTADRHAVFSALCKLTQSDDAGFGVRVLRRNDTWCLTKEVNN